MNPGRPSKVEETSAPSARAGGGRRQFGRLGNLRPRGQRNGRRPPRRLGDAEADGAQHDGAEHAGQHERDGVEFALLVLLGVFFIHARPPVGKVRGAHNVPNETVEE